MNNINPRELAIKALMDITYLGGYNNITLRKILSENNCIDSLNKRFVTEMVNGSLRNLIYIDYCLNYFSKTPTKDMKPFILSVLRVSVYQIIFLNKTPDSAACNEAVEITKKKFKNLAPFVNGVLRNIARNKNNIPLPDRETNIVEHLSIAYSCPPWVIKYWQVEMDILKIEEILKNFNQRPHITICVNTLKTDRENLVNNLEESRIICQKGLLEHSIYISNTADISAEKTFKDGYFHVMDESSMLAINLLEPKVGMTIMDVCAAPGGKSFYTSYLMGNRGEIFAYDIHQHKIELMLETCKRLGILNMNIEKTDSTVFRKEMENKADCLLLDAPCSGLGLIRKKPDIKYMKTMIEVENLAKAQREIFQNVWRYVKVGGTLLYSTCTISRKENIENIDYFLNHFPFKLLGFKHLMPKGLSCQTADKGYIQILPKEHNWDGFFIAKLIREE